MQKWEKQWRSFVVEEKKRGRPPKDKTAETRSLRLTDEDWEALQVRAQALGFKQRAPLIRAIARGLIPLPNSLGEF